MNKNKRYLASTMGVSALLAASLASGALAEDQPKRRAIASTVEEVVVTAQKREQSTSDLGISVSALSGDELSALGMQSSNDIVNFIPNIEHTAIFGPGTNPNYSIRGVTQNDYNDATEAPIATYVDDVYFVTTGAGSFPLYDQERVEVLRGPQGTLFGRNSTGGVMHFISNDPTEEFEGEIKVGFGSYATRRVSGFVNVPVTDNFQFRIAGYTSKSDGYLDHQTGNQPDAGETDNESVRLTLAFQPTENISDVLKISQSISQGNTSGVWRDAITQSPTDGLLSTLPKGTLDGFGFAPVHKYKEVDQGGPRELKRARSRTVSNTLDWAISDSVELTSVTAYNEYTRDLLEDCDGIQAWLCQTHYDNSSHQFSQELRAFIDLGEQRYTVGAYYLEQSQNVDQIAPLFVDVGHLIGLPGGLLFDADAKQELKGYAVFANGEFDLNEKFTLVAGVRFSKDENEMDSRFAQYGSPTGAPGRDQWAAFKHTTDVAGGALLSEDLLNDTTGGNSFSKDSWNAKIELDYKPTDDMLIYGSISRGTKAPGYNHGFVSAGLAIDDYFYKEEELIAYEVGIKTTFWDQKASLNAAAFYYDYTDYHTLSFIDIGSYLTNSDAELYGAEFDLTVRPIEGLTLKLNAGILESTLYDVPNSAGFVDDWEMPIAPSWTLAGSINYEFYVGDNIMGLQLDGRARDEFTNDPADNPASTVDGYGTANARAYLLDSAEKWEVSLSVKNLADKQYETSIFLLNGIGGYRYGFDGPPRMWSADITYRF